MLPETRTNFRVTDMQMIKMVIVFFNKSLYSVVMLLYVSTLPFQMFEGEPQ